MSFLYISVAAGLNAAVTAYWLCQLYEVAYSAFPLALRLSRRGSVSKWVFASLTAQLLGAVSIALVASYLVVALSSLPLFSEEQLSAWPLSSAALGVVTTGLALRIAPSFREDLDAAGHRRVLPFVRLSKQALVRALDS
jgi:hypothetical protein